MMINLMLGMYRALILQVRCLLFVLAICSALVSSAQLLDMPSMPPIPHAEIDSNYLQVENSSWSIRAFGTFKMQGLLLSSRESDTRLVYAPIALYSTGVGINYKYLTVDFGFNPISASDVENSRLALAASLAMPKSILDFSLHEYRGYNLRNHDIENNQRADIRNLVISINHQHLFNLTRVNIVKILQGGSEVKKGGISFSMGAFLNYHRLKADSTLVPPEFQDDFNDYGLIRRTSFFETGMLLGFTQVIKLPKRLFFVLSGTPGLGINLGTVEARDLSYKPGPWVAKMVVKTGIGYSGLRHYYLLSLTLNGNFVNIRHDNSYAFTSGQVKLVMGFRIKKRIKQLDQILGE